jgi:DNA helicase-2/ATP-dependent DNA helicase PcrA
VDEFQDINRLDFVLVEAIAKKAALVVTGDDDQAIYGFRGCTPEFIIDLEKHLGRPVESHELQINYRCPPVIVEHADRLIRHNTWRIPKNPRAASDAMAQIHVVSSVSAGLEAKSIVKLIQRVRSSDPTLGYNDFVVLYRTNAQSLPLQVEFIHSDIPYYVRPQDNILQNEALDRLLSILRVKLALDEGAEPSLRDSVRTVCSFFRRVEPRTVSRLESAFRQGRFMENLESEQVYRLLPEKGRAVLPFAMHELMATRPLLRTLDVIAARFRGVYGMIGSLEEVVQDWVPLGEIYEIAAAFHGDIEEFVQSLEAALARAKASHAGHDHKSGVPLLTYFRSKGLQWHTVILTTCNEGLIPHQKAQVEEERRLFYVAMTRATSNLVLSYVKSACGCHVPPSRFLYDAGLLEEPGRKRRGGAEVPSPDGYVALAKSPVFHRPECRSVKKTEENRLTKYAARNKAVEAGKRPCSQCKP